MGQDLNEWRLASGRPHDGQLVFPRADGAPWKKHDYHNWRADVFRPVARSVGLEGTRIYDLRHSFASLLLAEGRNPVEVAEQLGHAPSRTLDTYAHVIAELRGRKEVRADTEIQRARETACGLNVAQAGGR